MESSTCLFEPITFASFLDQSKCRIVLLFFIGEGNDVCLCVCVVLPSGHGFCSCGRCICSDGWFGKHCQFPRSCNMTDEQSKSLCETAYSVMCSGKGKTELSQCCTLSMTAKVGDQPWCSTLPVMVQWKCSNHKAEVYAIKFECTTETVFGCL